MNIVMKEDEKTKMNRYDHINAFKNWHKKNPKLKGKQQI